MKKLSWIFIIVGFIFIMTPIIGRVMNYYIEGDLVKSWERGQTPGSSGISKVYNKIADIVGFDNTSNNNLSQIDKSASAKDKSRNNNEQKVLGIIKIDKIKISLPIVEGVKASNLRVGIGHMPGSASLGKPGNCIMAGHRSYTLGRFFNKLNEVHVGDSIVIVTKQKKYTYKVYDTLVVTPEDGSVLKNSGKDNIITLITCTPVFIASHRLIVKARLSGIN